MRIVFVALLTLVPSLAVAEVCGPRLIVDFEESAPKDYFRLKNASETEWRIDRVEIDLRGSGGGLIFDVTGRGAGVSVYQPFERAGGKAVVRGRSEVTDGDSTLSVAFDRFNTSDMFIFTIDVDDTLVASDQTRVSGGEIAGGLVRAWFQQEDGTVVERTGSFETDSRADTGKGEKCVISGLPLLLSAG